MANDTRQKLIDIGYDLFSRNGFHMIGLDRILAEVGVSKQTFYNHFESKDELILAVLKRRSQWELQALAQMLQQHGGDDPRAQLYALFDVLDAWLNDPEFRGCIFSTAAAEFPAQHDPAHQAAADHARATIALWRERAERAGAREPQLLAEGLQILLDGALIFRHVTGNTRAATIARRTGTLLLDQHLPALTQPASVPA